MNLLSAVLDINSKQPDQVFRLLGKHFPSLAGKRIAVLGLSFRPDTNDMRESPAIPIVRRLVAEKAIVSGYDPAAGGEAKHIFGDSITLAASLEACLQDADAVVLVTRWKEFNRVPGLLKALAKPPVLVDGRRMLPKDAVPRYEGIGL
jgi:UDPglucose 6-dehydrogenase/GDP-mannose 6-dehydrogenase